MPSLPPRRGSLITGTTTSGGGGGGGGSAFISVKDHGAVGNGTTSDTAAINTTITFAKGLPNGGGGRIYFPGPGKYKIDLSAISLDSTTNNLTFYGDGDSSVLQFVGVLAAGSGRINIAGSTSITFEDLLLDGGKTTSTQLDWSTVLATSDPMQTALTQNSMVWVHGGSSKLKFIRCTFTHTDGYACLLDATSTGDISEVEFDSCTFVNNRAHTFGTGGVNTYQSWTSGIHYQGDGTNFCVRNLSIHDCSFRRSPGSQIWGHLYAFSKMHKNISVDHCTFEDVGLEGVEMGGVDGGGVTNCFFHRTGFVTGNSDTATPTPAWLANHQGTALDTAGLCTNLVYANNRFLNCNGGQIDMDGFGNGVVSGNSVVVSQPGSVEYTADQVASFGPGGAGPQYCYGINCDNTSGTTLGGQSNTITGNFLGNIGGGAIRIYAARNCKISGNNINHSVSFVNPPISLGPIAAGANFRATANIVSDNVINWNPGTMQAAVVEDPSVTAFVATDKNWVVNNQIALGSNVWEFSKDPNSGSVARIVLSSMASGLTTSSETWVQRESALTRWYKNVNGVSVAIMTLQDAGTYGTLPATPGPFLNVTNGAGAGGVVTTGARTTLAFDDAVAGGKLYADSLIALTDTTYVDSDANILNSVTGPAANVALIRYKKSVGYFEQSVTVSAGVRVWGPLLGAAATDKQVLFISGSSIVGNANLTFDSSTQLLTTVNITATGRILANGSFSLAASGSAPSAPASGFAKWYFDTAAGILKISYNPSGVATAYIPLGAPGGGNTNVQFRDSDGSFAGSNNFNFDKVAQAVSITGLTGTPGLNVLSSYISTAQGLVTLSASDNSIQSPNGGLSGRRLIASFDLVHVGVPTVAAPTGVSGQGKLYYDNTTNKWMVVEGTNAAAFMLGGGVPGVDQQVIFNRLGTSFGANSGLTFDYGVNQLLTTVNFTATGRVLSNGSYIAAAISAPSLPSTGFAKWYFDSSAGVLKISYNLSGSATAYIPLGAPGGSNQNVQFKDSDGSFNGTGDFIFDKTNKAVTITALNSSSFGLNVAIGYIQSTVGYVSTGAADTTVNIPNGGVSGRRHIASFDYVHTGVPTVAAPTGASGQGKLYYDVTTNLWMAIQGATSAVPLLAGAVAGSSGQVQYNSGVGTFAASSGLTWDNTANQLLTTVNITATGRVLANGSFSLAATATPSVSGTGFAKWYYDSTSHVTKISFEGGTYIPFGVTGGSNQQVQFRDSDASFAGSGNFIFDKTAQAVTINALNSASFGLNVTTGYIQSAIGYVSVGAADTTVNIPNGGISGRRHIASFDIVHTGVPTVSAPTGASGQGKLYYDTTTNRWMVIQGLSSAVPMIGTGSTPGGADTQIQYNGPQGTGGSFSGSANHTWNNSLQRMSVIGVGGTAGIVCGTGFIQSDGGYLVTNTNAAYNTIQSSGGAVLLGAIQTGNGFNGFLNFNSAASGFFVHTIANNQIGGVVIDGYDQNGVSALPILIGRRVFGSPGGSTSNLPINTFLFSFGARGSTTSGIQANAAGKINFMTTESWSPSANGAEIQFQTTPNGGTANRTALVLRNTGTVEVQFGFYAKFGLQADGAFYPLSQSGTPPAPASGYAGITHQSGSTWWIYNPSTFSWFTFNFGSVSGGGVTSLDTLTGALTLTGGTGITVTNNSPVSGSILISTSLLTSSNTWGGTQTFNGQCIFNAAVALSIWNFQSTGLFTGLTKVLVGSRPGISDGVFCGPGILMQFGCLASGYNVYLANNFNGTWQVAAGGGTSSSAKTITVCTSTLPTFITLYFIGGVLIGDSNTPGIYYNNFAVTSPY